VKEWKESGNKELIFKIDGEELIITMVNEGGWQSWHICMEQTKSCLGFEDVDTCIHLIEELFEELFEI
jgi:hypothetical protein